MKPEIITLRNYALYTFHQKHDLSIETMLANNGLTMTQVIMNGESPAVICGSYWVAVIYTDKAALNGKEIVRIRDMVDIPVNDFRLDCGGYAPLDS